MSVDSADLVLPRPTAVDARETSTRPPIRAPTEEAFRSTFGSLLPSAEYVATDNGRVAYYSLPPSLPNSTIAPDRVLFIHGVQTPALGMVPLVRTLHTSFSGSHFVLVDLYGHGLSDTPVVPHTPSLFYTFIDTLLDHLQWPSAHLVGFSFGGGTSVGYAASRGTSRVKSLSLVAPAGLYRSADFDAAHLRGDDEVAARKWVLNCLEGGPLVVPEDWKQRVEKGEVVAEAVRGWQLREHPGHAASVVGIFRDGGVMDSHAKFAEAAKAGIPSTIVLGASDDVCTEQELRDFGFPNVAVIPGGHGIVRESVPEVAALIRDFWRGL
ncbi:Serine hydrolase-like protein [Elsinoe australis]|uniref:Serine hydrolase-like protein n=1 Tax=Elsinoe australis TaxID=40998 RepID=A0A2P7YKT6_9PEZI|nr:Serine hydrolase-like protein [Elsinoe australis]